MSLHRILSLFVIVVAALALGAAVSLVVLTTYLHRTTLELETGLQSVKLAEEMQIDLLTYIGTSDPFARARAEADLRVKLHQARQYVGSPEEESLVRDADQLINAYFDKNQGLSSVRTDGGLERAFEALRQVIDINVEQAEASMRESEHWDNMADWIGLGCSVMLIIGIGVMLSWLRRAAFEPVFEIQHAIRDFASGHKQTRAPERGPEELRMIAKQFNEMTASLERQYENQLSFLAAVAHDLRNPISALKGSADILSTERHLTADTVSKIMSIIKRQVQGLDRMVGDLLDRSRIESGHLELRISDCDARTLAQNAFDLFNSASKAHHMTLALPEAPVPLRCDPLRIEQVLTNLVSNAVKYSPPGTKVELCLQEIEGEVRFKVADQGLGIPENELPYIFEPFRRTIASKDDVPGVGLGLSVAQRIVRAHDGRIEVQSQVGAGTTFYVLLPLHETSLRKLTA